MLLSEILNKLKQPVPPHFIKQKPVFAKKVKQKDVDFISWYDLCDLLDERCGLNGWQWSQNVTQVGNRVVVEGTLTIIGEDTQLSKSSQGNEEIEAFIMYGDCVSNSEAMALRRCCAKFGIARDLWRKEDEKNRQSLNTDYSSLPNKKNKVIELKPQSPEWWFDKGKKDALAGKPIANDQVQPYLKGYEEGQKIKAVSNN